MNPQPESCHSETPLLGQRVVFTGTLASMSRREAFRQVRRAGGEPAGSMSRQVHILVVGMKGWPVLRDGSVSLKLQRAEKYLAEGASLEIVSEKSFRERIGQISVPSPGPATCSLERACRLLALPPETVRRCEQFGLIRPRGGALAFQDLVSLRQISSLLGEGMIPAQIAAALSRLARILPEFEHPLAQVRLIASRGSLEAELQGARMNMAGQMLFDFAGEVRQGPASSVRLEPRFGRDEAEGWFGQGLRLESEGDTVGACRAYRGALRHAPDFAEAHYNLANLLLQQEDLPGAETAYREAIRHDPALACAWFNLGHVLAETNRTGEAVHVLQKTLELSADWADVHFNLALCWEELHHPRDAARHWRRYLKLDPQGPWAEMARNHLRRAARLAMEASRGK